MQTSDLAERIRNQDALAFEQVYRMYYDLLHKTAVRVLGSTAGADDVVQSVFMTLWVNAARFQGGNLPAWLVTIARNRSVDVKRRRATHPDQEMPPDVVDHERFEELMIGRIDASVLRETIASLPERERDLIVLSFYDFLSHAEIAKRTAIPLGTVKTRIRNGLFQMRALLRLRDVP